MPFIDLVRIDNPQLGSTVRFKLRGAFVTGTVVGFEGTRVKVVKLLFDVAGGGTGKTVYKRNRTQLFHPPETRGGS